MASSSAMGLANLSNEGLLRRLVDSTTNLIEEVHQSQRLLEKWVKKKKKLDEMVDDLNKSLNEEKQILQDFIHDFSDEEWMLHIPIGLLNAMKSGTWRRFDIEKIALSEFLSLFQLHKRDVYHLSNALRLKELTTSKAFCRMVNKTTDPVTVMCLLLYRMTKKSTLQELKHIFLMSESAISFIFNKSIEHIFPLIENQTIFNESLLGLQQLESYKLAIQNKFDQIITSSYSASKLEDPDLAKTGCIGFLDGTGVKVRKPSHDPLQVSLYNGNKKKHLLAYQVLTLPNGLVGHCSFPGNGARHDLTVLDQSNLIPKLKALWDHTEGYCLLGDKAYDSFQNKDKIIIASQKHSKRDNLAVRFSKKVKNRLFSKIRIVNEWNMTLVSGHFKYPFDGDRKVLSERISEMVILCVFLANFKYCCNRNQISRYYQLLPPSPEEFLRSYNLHI